MTRDDVIRMAWDAGVWIPMGSEREKCVDTLQRFAHLVAAAERAKLYALPGAQPSYLPSDLAEAIIADMQAQYDSELITENDSCEALIRLDGAIAAVEDNFAAATEAKP